MGKNSSYCKAHISFVLTKSKDSSLILLTIIIAPGHVMILSVLDNIFVRFDNTIYQQVIRDKLISIFNDNSRYIDDILTIENPQFLDYVDITYQQQLKLNKD